MSKQIRQKRPASAQRAKIVMCGHSLGEICVLPPENTCHFGSSLPELGCARVNQTGKPLITFQKTKVKISSPCYFAQKQVYEDNTSRHDYKEPC